MGDSQLPTNDFADVLRILKTRSAAVRTEEDLECVCTALDATLSNADVVWASLSARQKLVLSKYFELHTVFEDGGRDLCVERTAGTGTKCDNRHTGGLYILIHGRATVSICGGPSLRIQGGPEVLGRLPIHSKDANGFFQQAAGEPESAYQQFTCIGNRQRSDVSVHFEKGSTYIVLPETQSRQFLDRLSASLVAKRVFSDIGIQHVLSKQTHEEDRPHTSLLEGQNKPTKVFQFRSGQILIKEGNDTDQMLFIATGSCLILRSNRHNKIHCVGSLLAPCFVGISALFGNGTDIGSDARQPVSVVAAADGHAFSFCSHCLVKSVVSCAKLVDAFQRLAQTQMEAWTITSDAAMEEDAPPTPVKRRRAPFAKRTSPKRDLAEILRSQKMSEDNLMDAKELEENNKLFTKGFASGKLAKSKFLSTLHDTISNDLRDVAPDAVRDREQWLLDGDKTNILADVMRALAEGCGVDFAKCEGYDPFHSFVTANANDAGNDLRMALQMPFRMTNRLRDMTKQCLGRQRPPEHGDEPDPLLTPCLSVVSRKMHGKTLPVVPQIKCAADTLAEDDMNQSR